MRKKLRTLLLDTLWRKPTTRSSMGAATANPPRRRPGVPTPFVYSADKPWGWLVYRDGKFAGQELALKHVIISIGREEDNEVWLDDDTISRYHAELAWEKGQVYVTDAGSLNGVLLNGRRIHASMPVKHNDALEIGGHHFVLRYAQQATADELDDPLLPQLRRVAAARNFPAGTPSSDRPLARPTVGLDQNHDLAQSSAAEAAFMGQEIDIASQETMAMMKTPPLSAETGAEEQNTPRPPLSTPQPETPLNLPFQLRLPSKRQP